MWPWQIAASRLPPHKVVEVIRHRIRKVDPSRQPIGPLGTYQEIIGFDDTSGPSIVKACLDALDIYGYRKSERYRADKLLEAIEKRWWQNPELIVLLYEQLPDLYTSLVEGWKPYDKQ